MKSFLPIIAVCALSACMGGGSGASTQVSTSSPTPMQITRPSVTSPATPVSGSFADMLNGVRANNGSAPVSFDARLGRAAQKHSDYQLETRTMSHTGRNGSNAGQRITAEGYQWRTWGENVARGQQSEADVLQAWVNSPGHQRNNVNPAFEDFGLAKAGSGRDLYWTLVLATER